MKPIFTLSSLLLALVLMASCDQSGKQETVRVQSQNDSLMLVVLQQQNELADLVSTLNETAKQLDGINEQISVNSDDETLYNKRERMMQQLETVKRRIEEKENQLEALQKKYKGALGENKELKKSIDRMKSEINSYQERIVGFENKIAAQNETIGTLSQSLSETQEVLAAQNVANEMQKQVIDGQDKLLNTGYYVVGNKSKLKELGLIEGGLFNRKRLTTKGFDTSVFTQIDIREVSEIPLGSKEATLLTPAPESSYELVKGFDKNMTLRIIDPTAFWSSSKYLVIKI